MTTLANHYPLYTPEAFQTETAEPSYWRASAKPLKQESPSLTNDIQVDVAIVGAGFTGLNAAYALAVLHGMNVAVIDAGEIGAGASGRNGGFCCIGGTAYDGLEQVKHLGLEEALAINRIERRAVDHVRALCEQLDIDVDRSEQGELYLAHKPKRFAEFDDAAAESKKIFGANLSVLTNDQLNDRGYGNQAYYGGLLGGPDYGLHPLKYIRGLADRLMALGVPIYQNSRCTQWTQSQGKHRLITDSGSIEADKVIFATNGYTPEGMIDELSQRIMPLLSSIRVTRPLTEDEITAQNWRRTTCAFDSRIMLNYFRLLPDNRVLWGGRGGTSFSEGAFNRAQRELDNAFNATFTHWKTVDVDYRWRGFVCFTGSQTPFVGEFRPNAYTSLGYHGNGVAMASWCGQAIAQQIVNSEDRHFTPKSFTKLPNKMSFMGMRQPLVKAAYLGYKFSDRWL